MKTNNQIYRAGDILLFKTMHGFPGCLQVLFDGPSGHAEIIMDDNCNGSVMTLGTNFDGMKFRTQTLNGDHCVLRAHFAIDELRMLQSIHNVYDDHDHKYAYAGLLNAAWQQFMDDLTGNTWKKHVPIRVGTSLFCSATVAACYEDYNGYRFHARGEKDMRPEVVTPNDLLLDDDFFIVKPFQDRLG